MDETGIRTACYGDIFGPGWWDLFIGTFSQYEDGTLWYYAPSESWPKFNIIFCGVIPMTARGHILR